MSESNRSEAMVVALPIDDVARASSSSGFDLPETMVEALERAYQLGFSRASAKHPCEEQDERERRVWRDGLRFAAMTQLSFDERRRLAQAKLACDAARECAMGGEPVSALRQLAIAEYRLQTPELGSEAKLLGRVELASAEAAVAYQAGDYAGSRKQLEQAREQDRALLDRHGSQASLAHGFHLVSKAMQLESAEGRFSVALAVGARALVTLAGGSPSGETAAADAGPWPLGLKASQALLPSVRRFLARQIVTEVGATFLYAGGDRACALVPCFAAELPRGLHQLELGPVESEWLRAKLLSPSEDADAHLEACRKLLENRRQGADTLWLMGALDLAQRLASTRSAGGQHLRRRIVRDASAHPAFPPAMRAYWSSLASRT
jgi:hypothetical protein